MWTSLRNESNGFWELGGQDLGFTDTASSPPPDAMKEPTKLAEVEGTIRGLLESINRVQFLKGKWLLISVKLTALQSHLSQVPISSENPLLTDLLWSLSAACSSAASLAALCQSPSPPAGGKLKTQNDIDSVSAKLDSHINDLEVLSQSGALSTSSNAAPPPLPAAASSNTRESVRAEARNLMTRLQIGSNASKSSALDSVLGLLQEDDKNVLIAVAQGIIPILSHLLDSSSSSEIKEKTVSAIAKISTVDSSKHVLLAEGLPLVNNLLRVLESGSIFAKEKTCIILRVLSNSKENARAIASRGGISSLLEVCIEGTPNSQALAATVLRSLSVFEEIRGEFIEENAVSTLLSLCNSGTFPAQENSIGCLCNLVSGNDELRLFFAAQGGITRMKNFWDSSPSAQSLEVVVHMTRSLSQCPNIVDSLLANGFVPRIVSVLGCDVQGARIAAAEAVYYLGLNSSSKSRREFGETGCIAPLVRMMDGKAVEEKEAAAKALSTLVINCAANQRTLRKEEKAIALAVQLLDPLLQNLDKKHPVGLLAALAHSKRFRKEMVAAGAREYLKKLAEKEVDGAKKLLDGLGHGKLWGVFVRP
ncbi:uncharacterized protein LOC127240701 [Andrographis paniculata]|uniref:uncharacterized protein LOC127240701 n=1 Tax=Andrographis paniculata TaxID=175694 RepID=UPI0021E7DABE|nr:uncharacterized protein LOC127240701 [Andrographis paniculata]